jgi:ABC-type amino acid transport system permease subunit
MATRSMEGTALTCCVIYSENEASSATEALLGDPQHASSPERHYPDQILSSIRAYSFGLGVVVGVVVPLAILSIHAFFFFREEVISGFFSSLVLSGLPMIMVPLVVLSGLNNMMHAVYVGHFRVDSSDRLILQEKAEAWEDVIEQMETRFLAGTVVGLLMAWAMEEVAIGQEAVLIISLFAILLLSCGSAAYYCKNVRGGMAYEDDMIV